MEASELEKLAQACTLILVKPILELIYSDPHQWSKRPCQTCQSITTIIGKPFGCNRYREERKSP